MAIVTGPGAHLWSFVINDHRTVIHLLTTLLHKLKGSSDDLDAATDGCLGDAYVWPELEMAVPHAYPVSGTFSHRMVSWERVVVHCWP